MQLSMVLLVRTVICGWLCPLSIVALSQNKSCEDPKAPRIAVITMTKVELLGASASPDVVALAKRQATAESKMAAQIRKQFGSNVCYLSDFHVLDDPKSFPQLSGSIAMHIQAVGSDSTSNIYALSVTVNTINGPYIENTLHIFTGTFLIEHDSDYEFAAKFVFQTYHDMIEELIKTGERKKSPEPQ